MVVVRLWRALASAVAALSLAAATACTGSMSGSVDAAHMDDAGAPGPDAREEDGAAIALPDGGGPSEPVCSADGPVETSTRRLSRHQLLRTLHEEGLGAIDEAAIASAAGEPREAVTAELIDWLYPYASRIGSELECEGEVEACVSGWLGAHLEGLWRRPASAEEHARLLEVATGVLAEGGDASEALSAVAYAILTSASFLFLAEDVAEPEGTELVRVSDHALVARLAYFLWDGPPDAEARALAAAGLEDAAVEGLVDQMLADVRAQRGLDRFGRALIDVRQRAPESAEVREVLALLRHIVRDGDGLWSTLMSTDTVFVTPVTAELYGVPSSGAAFEPVSASAGQRYGLLTTRQILSVSSTLASPEPSVTHRGLRLRRMLLCDEPRYAHTVEEKSLPEEGSFRERLAAAVEAGGEDCASCHAALDGLGAALGRYDALGRHLEGEGDESGEVVSSGDAAGAFASLSELSTRLGGSEEVRGCIASRLYADAQAMPELPMMSCASPAYEQFLTNGDLRALLRAIALSESFRSRR